MNLKYYIIFLCLLVYIAISSCAKQPIYIVNTSKDSISTKIDTSKAIRRDTIYTPGQSIVQFLPCPDSLLKPIIENKGGTHLTITNSKLGFTINCKADSLLHIIDSLNTTISKSKVEVKSTTITLPPIQVKYIPFYIPLIIGALLLLILGLLLKIIFKI